MNGITLDATGVVIRCPQCGQSNRLRFDTLGKIARCGRCQTELPRVATPVEVPSAAAFAALIGGSALPVLADFWAEWCGPCRMVAPELNRLAASHAGELLVVKVDTEALPDLASSLRVQSIPTMVLFQGGRELARTSGARPAAALQSFVEQALAQHAR